MTVETRMSSAVGERLR